MFPLLAAALNDKIKPNEAVRSIRFNETYARGTK
jgi:hypothetical protein